MSLFGDIARGLADVMTFGTNELAGNPVGKFADTVVSGDKSQEQANYWNQQSLDFANKQMALEREFAQNGIRWRVEDAVAAGLNPLVGAGASSASYSPVGTAFNVMPADNSVRNIGLSALSGMGQDLFRSVLAGSSASDKALEASKLKIAESQASEAADRAAMAHLALLRAQLPPSNPAIPSTQDFVNPDGSVVRMPSAEFAQAAHGTIGSQWNWMLNNSLLPSFKSLGLNLGREAGRSGRRLLGLEYR